MSTLKRIGKAAALDTSKWKDFIWNGVILLASTAVTYVTQNLASLDFGQYTGIIVAGGTLVLKYVSDWLATFMKKEVDIKPTPPNNDNGNFPVN